MSAPHIPVTRLSSHKFARCYGLMAIEAQMRSGTNIRDRDDISDMELIIDTIE